MLRVLITIDCLYGFMCVSRVVLWAIGSALGALGALGALAGQANAGFVSDLVVPAKWKCSAVKMRSFLSSAEQCLPKNLT